MLSHPGDIKPLGELLRERRRRLGFSQADVADAVCAFDRPTVTRQEVARWERGKRIPRGRTRKALAQALGLPVRLLDLAAATERAHRLDQHARDAEAGVRATKAAQTSPTAPVQAIRVALLDHGGPLLWPSGDRTEEDAPDLAPLHRELFKVMAAYQTSRYGEMLERLPALLRGAHAAVATHRGGLAHKSQRVLALSGQAVAMVLTKLGELDLAWTAAERGLAAAHRSGDEAVMGSLCRSVVHTLQSHGRVRAATRLTEMAADHLREHLTSSGQRSASVYGTLLLAGAMASARGGDRQAVRESLDEAKVYADRLGRDANHLWTAFGPTNVAIHRVATSVALGDMADAYRHAQGIDPTRLPHERRIRYALDLARVHAEHHEVDTAVGTMLVAERLAPEQVHHHVMSRQLVADLLRTPEGRRNCALRELAGRVQDAELVPRSTA